MRVGGWLPLWLLQIILPLCFAAIALRFLAATDGWTERAIGAFAAAAVILAASIYAAHTGLLLWGGSIALALAGLCGAPIFVVLGGLPLLLFIADGIPIASIPVEAYRLVVSPSIPTIPLFALAGYILAEGGASRRLFRVLRALFGWLPGGLPIVATLLCAFFTTFTGASGVTILALGGLLLPILRQSGCSERFSIGLLTASGSIGILFPPSLPVILYAVVARIPIPDLFRAGAIPGILLVGALCVLGFFEGLKSTGPRPAFDAREAIRALWHSKWDLLLPVVTLLAMFGGYCTLIEAAAITATYALLIEVVIYRELHLSRDLPRVLLACVTMMGGVFIILAGAMGLTNFLVDAQAPMQAAAWVKEYVDSRALFLLVLNLFIFVVGCLMDIYSAIAVQAPLLLPMGEAFGVNPLHLGVIFLTNLELGYLTPPVGLNLFLASYRFETPVFRVFRYTLPFLLVLLMVVLLITYVPALTLGVNATPAAG
jgi:tripartite ATP-independent transporter DctM subunit